MSAKTIILVGDSQRAFAKRLIDTAKPDSVVVIKDAARSLDQNAKMWAMLTDVSRAKPDGICHTADLWKAIFMKACGHQVQFVNDINGEPFPVGFRTSRLSKSQMSDLIECIYEFGARKGIKWSDPAIDGGKGKRAIDEN